MQDALLRIAELAPTLGQSQVRVLLELTRRAVAIGATHVSVSSRDLADAIKVSRRNVQAAIDELNVAGLLSGDNGSATRPATHVLEFLNTVPVERGADLAPPLALGVASVQRHPGAKLAPPVASQQRHPGVVAAPPPSPPITRVRAGTIETTDSDLPEQDRSTWRLLKANATDYDAGSISLTERLMHGYTQKFGTPTHEPPDPKICAELLTVFDGNTIAMENFFYTLSAERKKPGERWGWYVAVAVQRIWRMQPEELRERRARLSARRKPPVPQQFHSQAQAAAASTSRGSSSATAPPPPKLCDVRDMRGAIAAAATQKGMR